MPDVSVDTPALPIECPPPAAQPVQDYSSDARARLHHLAQMLMRSTDRRMLSEYLQLRRSLK